MFLLHVSLFNPCLIAELSILNEEVLMRPKKKTSFYFKSVGKVVYINQDNSGHTMKSLYRGIYSGQPEITIY